MSVPAPRAKGAGGQARHLALGCAAASALVSLLCLAGAAVLAVRPPSPASLLQPLVFRAGNFGLSAAVSGTPDCPPEIVDCAVPAQPNHLYGSLWFWVTTRTPAGVTASFKPLLRFRLR